MGRRALRLGLLVVPSMVALVVASSCSQSAELTTSRSTSVSPTAIPASTAPISAPTAIGVTSLLATSASSVPVGSVGCATAVVADRPTQEIEADVDGNGRADRVRTFRSSPSPPQGVSPLESLLQVTFDDGRNSQAASLTSPDILGAVDLDGDKRAELFVANVGNTGRGGSIWRLDGCALDVVRTELGEPFVYVFWGTGRGCAPTCYPSVHCDDLGSEIELVLSNASRANATGDVVPPLTDDLPYAWNIDRFRLHNGRAELVSHNEGTARHANLPVAKTQGFHCL